MILTELNDVLVAAAKSNFMVNEAFVGDVYDIDFKENRFAVFCATPMNAIRTEGSSIRYTYTLYYVDRLTKSEDNIDFVQSDAVTFLKGLMDFLERERYEVTSEYQFNLFKHRFDDWCAGAYVEVTITVQDTDCGEDDFNIIDLRTGNFTRNGSYVPEGFDGWDRVIVNVQGGEGDYATVEYVDEKVGEVQDEIDRIDSYMPPTVSSSNTLIDRHSLGHELDEFQIVIEGEITDTELGIKQWVEDKGYLTSHQPIKTINGQSLVGTGNIDIEGSGGGRNAFKTMRKIEDYFYEVEYDYLDYAWAKNNMAGPISGYCSVAEFYNRYIVRNYDWKYDHSAGFVMRTSSLGLHDVIGVGGTVNGLTGEFVDSGAYSDLYKVLPFYIQDGVNDMGLFCEVNVVPSWNNAPTIPTIEKRESISNVMLVRYILDHFEDVDSAIDYLTKYVEVYNSPALQEMGYELHYYLSDGTTSKILEVVDDTFVAIDGKKMFNFHIQGVSANEDGTLNTPETAKAGHYASANGVEDMGAGLERWNIVANADIEDEQDLMNLMRDLFYTNAYTEPWYSEFVGGSIDVNTPSDDADFQARIEEYQQKFEERSRDTGETWQSVHACLYNLNNKMFRVISQEGETYYDFTLEGETEYATKDYVDGQIDEVRDEIPDVSSYATISYVDETYSTVKTAVDLKADKTYVDGQISGVRSEIPSLQGYATETYVDTAISGVRSEIPSLDGYATEQWVEGKGYLTSYTETDPVFTSSPAHSITSSNITSWNGKFDASAVWTGTEAEWDALTPAQQATYTIALIR